jgi:hypothetical protein
VTSEQQNLPDGREYTNVVIAVPTEWLTDLGPFMWWHAIRTAWPEYNIPNPDHLRQRVEWITTPWEERNDNSLKALNYARNLLLYV